MTMKITKIPAAPKVNRRRSSTVAEQGGELKPEYRFDYSQAKPNRFAGRASDQVVVLLDPDVAQVFTDPAAVNAALRAILSAIPPRQSR